MKTLLILSCLVVISFPVYAAFETNGFLVFEVDRFAYSEVYHDGPETTQKFKVPVTDEFLANFKHVPSQNSGGTGFCCGGGHRGTSTNDGGYGFTWWLNKTADNRWYVHMWGQGYEKIKGVTLASGNPGVTQSMTFKRLEDLDMSYQQSYVNQYDGVNVQFSAKYVPAKDIEADGPIPTAPVRKADRTILFKGDDMGNKPIQLQCLFQEG
jgi:hypothetical protein